MAFFIVSILSKKNFRDWPAKLSYKEHFIFSRPVSGWFHANYHKPAGLFPANRTFAPLLRICLNQDGQDLWIGRMQIRAPKHFEFFIFAESLLLCINVYFLYRCCCLPMVSSDARTPPSIPTYYRSHGQHDG